MEEADYVLLYLQEAEVDTSTSNLRFKKETKLRKWMMMLLLLLPWQAGATVLSGTFLFPNSAPVNGAMYVQLERNGIRNTCSSTQTVVPTTPVKIPISNGTLQGSTDIVPTDCLSSFQPYLVVVKNTSNQEIYRSHWYIAPGGGAYVTPTTGGLWISPSGLSGYSNTCCVGITISVPLSFLVANNVAQVQTITKSVPSMFGNSSTSVVVVWQQPFSDTNYVAVCSVLASSSPQSSNMSVSNITGITKSQMTVQVTNQSISILTGKVTCRGKHT